MSTRSVNNDRTLRKMRGDAPKADERTAQEKAADEVFYTGKRSAASGKPARAQASGVTVVQATPGRKSSTSSGKNLSKEERKAQRKELRDRDDRVSYVADYYLRNDEAYPRMRRIWWGLLLGGFACIVVSFIIQSALQRTQSEALAFVGLAMLVLSYVGIIGAVIYDLAVIGKKRKAYRQQAESMSDKRLQKVIDEAHEAFEAEVAEEGDGFIAKVKRFFRN